jgi:hypothetical protein
MRTPRPGIRFPIALFLSLGNGTNDPLPEIPEARD